MFYWWQQMMLFLPTIILVIFLFQPVSTFTMTSSQINAVHRNEQLLRMALGVEEFQSGSFPSVLDESLYPRPKRLKRGHSKSKSFSTVASRHHVEYPVNTYISHDGTLFVASFQSNHVYKLKPNGDLELFARGTYCNTRQPCISLSGPWGITGQSNEIYVSSFSTDTILIFSHNDSSYLGSMGDAEHLNAPEGLCMGPNSIYLYVSSFLSGDIVQYNIQTRSMVKVIISNLPGPEGITFLLGSQLLAVACHSDHSVRLIDVGSITSENSLEVSRISNVTGGGNWSHPVGVTSSQYHPVKQEDKFVNNSSGIESIPITTFTSQRDILYLSAHHDLGFKDAIISFDVQRNKNHTTVVSLKNIWKGMSELKSPSGMSVSADTLFVAAYQSHRVLAYEINHYENKLELKASIRI